MPLYTDHAHSPVAAQPGDTVTLFDGTETPGSSVNSTALNRATGPGNRPSGIVFTIDYGSAPTAVVTIQASNADVDAQYQTLYTSTSTQNDYYADAGNFAWYRAHMTSYSAGGMPIVVAQR